MVIQQRLRSGKEGMTIAKISLNFKNLMNKGNGFLKKIFFPFKIFTITHIQKTFKSINQNSNYINQLLSLLLLKHTHQYQ